MILVLLAIVWIAVLLPPYLKGRANGTARPMRSDGNSIATHRQQLQILDNALGPGAQQSVNVIPFRRPDEDVFAVAVGSPVAAATPSPQPPRVSFAGLEPVNLEGDRMANLAAPMSRDGARRRRRNVLAGLVLFAVVTLVLAVTRSGLWVLVNLLADASMLVYVMLLVRFQQINADRMNKVRPIRPPGRQPSVQAAPDYLLQQSAN